MDNTNWKTSSEGLCYDIQTFGNCKTVWSAYLFMFQVFYLIFSCYYAANSIIPSFFFKSESIMTSCRFWFLSSFSAMLKLFLFFLPTKIIEQFSFLNKYFSTIFEFFAILSIISQIVKLLHNVGNQLWILSVVLIILSYFCNFGIIFWNLYIYWKSMKLTDFIVNPDSASEYFESIKTIESILQITLQLFLLFVPTLTFIMAFYIDPRIPTLLTERNLKIFRYFTLIYFTISFFTLFSLIFSSIFVESVRVWSVASPSSSRHKLFVFFDHFCSFLLPMVRLTLMSIAIILLNNNDLSTDNDEDSEKTKEKEIFLSLGY